MTMQSSRSAFDRLANFNDEGLDPQVVAITEEEVARKLEEAFERGMGEGRSAAEAACQIELENALIAAKSDWESATAARLASELADGLEKLEHSLEEKIAGCLKPVLDSAAASRAHEAFHAAVRQILAKDVSLRVSGSARLIEDLRAAFPNQTFSIEQVEGDQEHIAVSLGDTEVSLDLAGWQKVIEVPL